MSDILMMIDEKEQSKVRPASEIFKSTVGLTMHDGVLSVVFSTVENRKGYGKQYIPVADLESTLAVLQDARNNGIVNEAEQKSTPDIVRSSLIESEDGEVRFKTENSKGKKPTLCADMNDFIGFVDALEGYTPKIIAKAQAVQEKLNK